MKDNVYDEVLKRTLERVESVTDTISKNFKGVKPFDKKPIPPREVRRAYDSLSVDDMKFLIQRHGQEKVNQFIGEMETEAQGEFDARATDRYSIL